MKKRSNNYKHGLSGTTLYDLWATIKNRCYNENEPGYLKYGLLGVRMCDEWLNNPVLFIEWCKNNGWKKGLQIDKDIIAMSKGLAPNLYSPDRCQFVTPYGNSHHKKNSRYIEYNGQKKTLAEWSDELGIGRSTILLRLDQIGYSVEDALKKKDNRFGYNGVRKRKDAIDKGGARC